MPNISNWNTKNLINIKGLFSDCSSLSYIPDISKWDARNIIDMSYIFEGCTSLITIPDLAKWKINTKVKNNKFAIFIDLSNLLSNSSSMFFNNPDEQNLSLINSIRDQDKNLINNTYNIINNVSPFNENNNNDYYDNFYNL